jgi:hypothetical protein
MVMLTAEGHRELSLLREPSSGDSPAASGHLHRMSSEESQDSNQGETLTSRMQCSGSLLQAQALHCLDGTAVRSMSQTVLHRKHVATRLGSLCDVHVGRTILDRFIASGKHPWSAGSDGFCHPCGLSAGSGCYHHVHCARCRSL